MNYADDDDVVVNGNRWYGENADEEFCNDFGDDGCIVVDVVVIGGNFNYDCISWDGEDGSAMVSFGYYTGG